MKKTIYFLSTILFLISCSTEKKQNTEKQKPPSNISITPENFTEGEILVVIDTSYWNGAIGDSIRKIFMRAVYGLPQGEPYFKVRRVDPQLFKGTLQKFNNIFIVANINNNSPSGIQMNGLLGNKNIEKAKKINAPPYFVNSDLYAKGQHLLYVLATSDNELKEKLSVQRDAILHYFDKKVAEQLENRYYYGKYNENLTQKVATKFNVDFHIPKGFQFAKEAQGFLWVRFPEMEIDKNIIISELNYVSENQFEDAFIARWRDSLGFNLIKEANDTLHYMMTQEYMPLSCEVWLEDSAYAKLCRGLWKLKDNSLGGPFISMVTLNKSKTKIYYIEGFAAAPSISKRKLIRELRAVISSFKG